MNTLPAQKVNGLIDGLAALQELALAEKPVSGLELSERLNINQVRANRLLKTLAFLGFAYRSDSRKYGIGPAMHVLAAQSMRASGLLRKTLVHLEQLGHSGRTVALGVLWKTQVCYLYHRNPSMSLWDGIGGMPLLQAETSSIGMALLANLTDDEIKNIYPEKDVKKILDKINDIREKGYSAIEHPDHISLAVAIGKPAYAAIAVSNIKDNDEFNFFLKQLLKIVAEIE